MFVTNFYFIQLVLKIKYVEFENNPKIFYKKPENVKVFFCKKTNKGLPTKKMENTNIARLSAKVVNNQFDRTHCDD